jgi:signal transduction histidine kinase/ligand-binding sensor domain-containing protein
MATSTPRPMRRAVYALAVLLLLLPSRVDGERLPIRAYTTADGLAHNTVNAIVRDSRGFLWFATHDGLSRFDGYTFTNYSVEQGLPHRQVMGLLETRSGELWVATFGGLVYFRPHGVPSDRVVYANSAGGGTPMFATIVPPDEDPRARALLALLEASDGTIWCGTRKGLFRLERDGGRFELRHVAVGMPDEYPEQKFVNDLVEDEHGSLWVATPSGLYRRWSDGTSARYAPSRLVERRYPNLPRSYDHLHDLMKDRQGRIWVGARGLGFFRLTPDGSRRAPAIEDIHAYPQEKSSWIERMLETSDGRFWATSNLGILELRRDGSRGSRLVAYNRSHGLSHQELTALAEDTAGNLWIGTWSSGVMKLARSGFVTYGRADGIAFGGDVFEDATGALNVFASIFKNRPADDGSSARGDEYQLASFGRFDGRRFEWFKPAPPFEWGSVGERCFIRTRNGEYWLATGYGLFRYPPLSTFESIKTAKPIRIFDTKDGLPDVQVFRLFEDSRHDVWFSIISGIRNGLFRWSRATDTLRNMAVLKGFPRIEDELPRAIGEDAAGNIWIGLNNGVARYRNDTFALFTAANGMPLGRTVDIRTDAAQRLWLASSHTGLIRVDDTTADAPAFRRYTTAEGLSSNSLEVITEDLHGRLYLATARGIDQLDPNTGAVRQFTTEDGLAAGTIMSASRDRTGALWFGTQTGLSRFVPTPPVASVPPAILITGVTVGGRPWPVSAIGETLLALPDLRPGGHHLQIDFASLRFAAGERLRYQYRLEGSDENWGPIASRRSVTFASFSAGTYRFLVRAVSADGVVSPEPAVVTFTVLPPFWLRWWFLSLAAAVVGAAALSFHRYRLARILELERVRTRIATDLHDDVGANLTRIAILSEVARQQPRGGAPELDAPLSSIADIARESVATMSDIVWAITPERDTLRDMVRRMRDHAEELFEARDIRLILDLPDLAHSTRLGVDVRRDLYLIFKEAVNNAARHSRCSTVAIVLRTTGSELSLEVTDDGVGIDRARGSEGNGLGSMRGRAGRLGGLLDVVSAPGTGTTVRLRMPIRESAMAGHPTPKGR